MPDTKHINFDKKNQAFLADILYSLNEDSNGTNYFITSTEEPDFDMAFAPMIRLAYCSAVQSYFNFLFFPKNEGLLYN